MHRRSRHRLIGARKCVLGVGSYHGRARSDVSPHISLYHCITYINIVIHRRLHVQPSCYFLSFSATQFAFRVLGTGSPLRDGRGVDRPNLLRLGCFESAVRCPSGPPYGMVLGGGKWCPAVRSPLFRERFRLQPTSSVRVSVRARVRRGR